MKNIPLLLRFCCVVVLLGVISFELFSVWKKASGDSRDSQFPIASVFFSLKGERPSMFQSIYKHIGSLEIKGGIEGVVGLIEYSFKEQAINQSECHTLLHALGHTAYGRYPKDWQRLATSKSTLCVASFEHGVEAQIAIAQAADPTQMVSELQAYCVALREKHPGITCYHGAGHAFLQRTKGDVNRALGLCDSLKGGPVSDLQDCYRGIFSEFGSEALGIDGDTGLPIAGVPRVEIVPKKPFDVCVSIGADYQRACVSQLSKIYYKNDVVKAMADCIHSPYLSWIRERCIMTIAGIHAMQTLSSHESMKTPVEVVGYTPENRAAYIAGTAEGFVSFSLSGIQKDWQSWCGSFAESSDAALCREYMNQVRPLPI